MTCNKQETIERVPEVTQKELADKGFTMTKINMFKNLKGKNIHKE